MQAQGGGPHGVHMQSKTVLTNNVPLGKNAQGPTDLNSIYNMQWFKSVKRR